MFNKRSLTHKILSSITQLFSNKKTIVFFAPYAFHARHMLPVIDQLMADKKYRIILVGAFKEFKELNNIQQYNHCSDLPIIKKYHLFILSEIEQPWELKTLSGLKIFFGHGIGPKLNYQATKELKLFDQLFVPCEPIFQVQQKLSVPLREVGLPLLDLPIAASYRKDQIIKSYNLDANLPLIVYAPSWNYENHLVSDVVTAVNRLVMLENYNVIFSPHPNLLIKDKYCRSDQLYNVELPINTPETGISTFDLCMHADIVISDISSILFEAMAIGKAVAFDGNTEVYRACEAGHVLDELQKHLVTLEWHQSIEGQLESCLSLEIRTSVNEYIDGYVFNRGQATRAFIHTVNELI